MGLKVEIVSMSQDLDLTTGDVTHFLFLQLPSGELLRTLISDEGAAKVVAVMTGGPAPVVATAPVPAPVAVVPTPIVLTPEHRFDPPSADEDGFAPA